MRRLLAIVLFVLLPLQFSWAAVASYCGHEKQLSEAHFGHHEHEHRADASRDAGLDADLDANVYVKGNKTPTALDLDCSFCHGYCGVLLTLPSGPPDTLSMGSPSSSLDEACGALPPTRPERPRWLPLA